MNDLALFIKVLNSYFTDKDAYVRFATSDFDVETSDVNYEGTISLSNLVSSFNEEYVNFIKEYNDVCNNSKCRYGSSVEFLRYSQFNRVGKDQSKGRILNLHVDKPYIVKAKQCVLSIDELRGNVRGNVISTEKGINEFISVYVDKQGAINLLDLFEKYKSFIYLYSKLRKVQLSSGWCYLFSKIDEGKHTLLKGLNELRLSFGSEYCVSHGDAVLSYSLGENYGINYDKCSISGEDIPSIINRKDMDEVSSSVVINAEQVGARVRK